MNLDSQCDANFLFKMHEGLQNYILPRLFFSATELSGLFENCPKNAGDVIVVFTKSGAGDTQGSEINPRQSFCWRSDEKAIYPFHTVASMYETLGVTTNLDDPIRQTRCLLEVVATSDIAFELLNDSRPSTSIYIFVQRSSFQRVDVRVFFDLLLPYLELYRKSTLHAINDAYKTRDDELLTFSKEMNPSAWKTAQSLLKLIAKHRRFRLKKFALLKYSHEHCWIDLHSSDSEAAITAMEAVGAHFGESNTRRVDGEDIDVIKSKKMLGIVKGKNRVAIIPFVRVHPQMTFRETDQTGQPEVETTQEPARKKMTPDLVIVLMYDSSPPQGVIHSLLYFRNYYFDVYFPALLAHTKAGISNKTRDILEHVNRAPREQTSSNPWQPFAEVCATSLSVLCNAYNLGVTVSIYNLCEHALAPVFQWDPSKCVAEFAVHESEWKSLRKGKRGLAAGLFNDVGKNKDGQGRNALYVSDVSKGQKGKAMPIGNGDEGWPSVGSRFLLRLRYRSTSIGVVTFFSSEVHAFDFQLQELLASFVHSLEDYLRAFFIAHDSLWLSITAGAYHNLHELRQISETWKDQDNRAAVDKTVAAFDQVCEGQDGSVSELQAYFDMQLRKQADEFVGPFREDFVKSAALRCTFNLIGHPDVIHIKVPRTTIELVKRVFKNLLNNFCVSGDPGAEPHEIETFSISTQTKPFISIRFRQEQNTQFPDNWLGELGFRPTYDDDETAEGRLHHGLFLCSAIARYLGGFSWIGNMNDPKLGIRSVVDITIPLTRNA